MASWGLYAYLLAGGKSKKYASNRDDWTQSVYPFKTDDFTLSIIYSNNGGRKTSTI